MIIEDEELRNAIGLINEEIQFLGLVIRGAHSEINSSTYWGICNTFTDDEISTMSAEFKPKEIAFYRLLVITSSLL